MTDHLGLFAASSARRSVPQCGHVVASLSTGSMHSTQARNRKPTALPAKPTATIANGPRTKPKRSQDMAERPSWSANHADISAPAIQVSRIDHARTSNTQRSLSRRLAVASIPYLQAVLVPAPPVRDALHQKHLRRTQAPRMAGNGSAARDPRAAIPSGLVPRAARVSCLDSRPLGVHQPYRPKSRCPLRQSTGFCAQRQIPRVCACYWLRVADGCDLNDCMPHPRNPPVRYALHQKHRTPIIGLGMRWCLHRFTLRSSTSGCLLQPSVQPMSGAW